jgi:hypothetical protein
MEVSILLLSSLTHHQRSYIRVIEVSILLLSSLTHHQRPCIRVMEVSILLLEVKLIPPSHGYMTSDGG